MKKSAPFLPLVLFAAGCAGGPPPEPPAPPPLDPTGAYDCMISVEGMDMGLTLTIAGEEGAYTGTMDSEMGPAPVRDIAVEGNRMTFLVDAPDMVVSFAVLFEGDDFTGDFDAGGMAGFISGTKR
jgi:hypothetical protein